MAFEQELTLKEKEAIEELKQHTLQDLSPKLLEDESLFYRFCKARDFNVRNAEAMLRKHIQFRKDWQVDTILHNWKIPEVIWKYFSISLVGYDKKGRAVRYIDFGKGDLKTLIHSARLSDHIKYVFYNLENDIIAMKENSQKLGIPVTQTVYICNFYGLSISNAMDRKLLQGCITFMKYYLDNYPERLKYVCAINTSTAFKLAFPIVKRVLPHSVQQKIHVFSSDGWKEFLRDLIDDDVLPAFLGGKRTDPDGNPRCVQSIIHGMPIPKDYRLDIGERKLSKAVCVKMLNIPFLSMEQLCYEVDEEGSELVWEFQLRNRDVDFGLFYRETNGKKLQEMVPKHRVDADYEAETGFYHCEKTGTYVLMFDNSYSWIHSKDIFYRVGIKSPNSNEEPTWM